MPPSRRIVSRCQIVGRVPEDYASNLQRWIDEVTDNLDNGIPSGASSVTPSEIQAGVSAAVGAENGGWARGGHIHSIKTGAPTSATGKTAAEGSGAPLMRAGATVRQGIVSAKGDILSHDGTTAERLPVGVPGSALFANPSETVGMGWALFTDYGIPQWVAFEVGFAALAKAALANDIELFSLVPAGVIQGVLLAPSQQFLGPGIVDYKVSVGIVGNLVKYAPAFDVDTVPGGTNFQLSTIPGCENVASAVSIRLSAVSVGANLDQATAGSVSVGVLYAAGIS